MADDTPNPGLSTRAENSAWAADCLRRYFSSASNGRGMRALAPTPGTLQLLEQAGLATWNGSDYVLTLAGHIELARRP